MTSSQGQGQICDPEVRPVKKTLLISLSMLVLSFLLFCTNGFLIQHSYYGYYGYTQYYQSLFDGITFLRVLIVLLVLGAATVAVLALFGKLKSISDKAGAIVGGCSMLAEILLLVQFFKNRRIEITNTPLYYMAMSAVLLAAVFAFASSAKTEEKQKNSTIKETSAFSVSAGAILMLVAIVADIVLTIISRHTVVLYPHAALSVIVKLVAFGAPAVVILMKKHGKVLAYSLLGLLGAYFLDLLTAGITVDRVVAIAKIMLVLVAIYFALLKDGKVSGKLSGVAKSVAVFFGALAIAGSVAFYLQPGYFYYVYSLKYPLMAAALLLNVSLVLVTSWVIAPEGNTEGKEFCDSHYIPMATHVLLLFFTFGIWQFVWIYKMTNFANRAKEAQKRSAGGCLALCMFVPIYQFVWTYKTARRIYLVERKHGEGVDMSGTCLALSFFVPFIPPILMQARVNAAIRAMNATKAKKADSDSDSTAKASDSLEDLFALKKMLDDGVITEEEFNAKKHELLGI